MSLFSHWMWRVHRVVEMNKEWVILGGLNVEHNQPLLLALHCCSSTWSQAIVHLKSQSPVLPCFAGFTLQPQPCTLPLHGARSKQQGFEQFLIIKPTQFCHSKALHPKANSFVKKEASSFLIVNYMYQFASLKSTIFIFLRSIPPIFYSISWWCCLISVESEYFLPKCLINSCICWQGW